MGNWNFSLKGVGSHDNGIPQDIEQLALDFIKRVEATGHHTLSHAELTIGGSKELLTESGRSMHVRPMKNDGE